MKIFFFVLLTVAPIFAEAQDERIVSFFFNINESQPVPESMVAIDTFNLYIDKHPIVVLEINSYSSKDGTVDINQTLATHRLNTVKAFLNPNAEILATNVRGINYPAKLIYPENDYAKWRRVDVIYKLLPEIQQEEIKVIKVDSTFPHKDLSDTTPKTIENEEPENMLNKKPEPGMVFQLELNIQFFDGSDKLTPNSYPEIDELAKYMNENPNVHAFIRGHVCCGKAMKLSKQRAKVVAKELIKRGVSKKRLRSQGFSNNLPMVSPEKTEADRKKNRRVDIIFSVKEKK